MDFSNKTVLELGAGAGRLTFSLLEFGAIEKAEKYIVVEPSDGIRAIESGMKGRTPPNVFFINCPLEKLNEHIPAHSVDYFIASGVLPHISMELPRILELIASFLSAGGELHVVASYYGFDKGIAHAIRRKIVGEGKLVRKAAALSNALAQDAICGLKFPESAAKFYMENFIYSPQKTIEDKYKQFYEFYSVAPYNIERSYRDYVGGAKCAGLELAAVYPYSVALKFRAGGHGHIELPSPGSLGDRDVILLGEKDFFTAAVGRKLSKKGIKIKRTMTPGEIMKEQPRAYIILGGNHYIKPYHEILKQLEYIYTFNEDIFIFQMFV
jgi:hypothetical protein